jgi:hypothetical protein
VRVEGFSKISATIWPFQGLLIVRRALGAAIAGGLHLLGGIDHRPKVGGGSLVDIEEVVHVVSLFDPAEPGVSHPRSLGFSNRWRNQGCTRGIFGDR